MGRMSIVSALLYKIKGAAPGKAIVLKTSAAGDQTRETEHYQLHGIASGSTAESRTIEVSIGTAGRVIVATHNYNLELEVEAGQTRIYSTKADGKTLMGEINLAVDGAIEMNGNSKTFVTHAELDTALQSFISSLKTHTHNVIAIGSPTATPLPVPSIDISAAETTTIKTGG